MKLLETCVRYTVDRRGRRVEGPGNVGARTPDGVERGKKRHGVSGHTVGNTEEGPRPGRSMWKHKHRQEKGTTENELGIGRIESERRTR